FFDGLRVQIASEVSMRNVAYSCLNITILGLLLTTADAATWNGPSTGSGAWNTNANWTSPATFPNGVDAAAIFPSSLTGNLAVNLTQAITVGSIDVSNSGTTQVLTIANGGGSLLFDVTSGNAAFTMGGANPTTNNVTVSASVTLNDTLNFT